MRGLTPYLGLRGQAAEDYRHANPLVLTAEAAQEIERRTFTNMYDQVAERYNQAAAEGLRFEELPQGAQTAVMDLAYQYGPDGFVHETPNFFRQVTEGRWQEAHDNLMNFGDAHRDRREEEGGLIQQEIQRGRLPSPLPRQTPAGAGPNGPERRPRSR